MASILRVDTLTDASSNNSTAMSTINQGTAKAWVQLNGTGTYKPTFTNAMGNGNYAIASICDLAGYVFLDSAQATTDCQLANRSDGSGDTDSTFMGVSIHGDLA